MRALMAFGVVKLRSTQRVRGAVEHFYELTGEGQAVVRAAEAVADVAPPRFRRASLRS